MLLPRKWQLILPSQGFDRHTGRLLAIFYLPHKLGREEGQPKQPCYLRLVDTFTTGDLRKRLDIAGLLPSPPQKRFRDSLHEVRILPSEPVVVFQQRQGEIQVLAFASELAACDNGVDRII